MPKRVSKKSFGGRISDLWDALWSDRHLPKRFRNFLKAHGDESITSIEMFRLPVDHVAEAVAQLITAGDFEGIKKRSGVDRVFHVGMLINNKYTLEKLAKPEFREDVSYRNKPDIEFYDVPVNKELSINEFIEKAREKMGENFYNYDFLKNNCQNFVVGLLEASHLLTVDAKQWIKQDIESLIREMPSLSKYLGVRLTDTARNLENIGEELFYRRGGKVRRKYM